MVGVTQQKFLGLAILPMMIESNPSSKGVTLNSQTWTHVRGVWSSEVALHHIKYLLREHLEAFLAIRAFGKTREGITIL